MTPAVETRSLNHWTAREVPVIYSLKVQKIFSNPEVIKYLFHLQDFYCVIFFPHFPLVHLEFIFIYHARWGSKLIFSPKWLRHKPSWCDIMFLFYNTFLLSLLCLWPVILVHYPGWLLLHWNHTLYYMNSMILSVLSPVYPQHLEQSLAHGRISINIWWKNKLVNEWMNEWANKWMHTICQPWSGQWVYRGIGNSLLSVYQVAFAA